MSIPGTLIPLFNSGGGASYSISRSLRFNSADSAHLSRTPASAGNRTTWTWAGWVKKTVNNTSEDQCLFGGHSAQNDTDWLEFGFGGSNDHSPADKIYWTTNNTSSGTTAVYRDNSAWYHIVATYDGSNLKFYVNNELVLTSAKTGNLGVNVAGAHAIGKSPRSVLNRYFNGYLADVYFIDGQALTPSSFTETDATTGQLIPKAFSGSYGSQGWHLEFADNSAATATTLGKDTSGNGNNWTPNNLSVVSSYSTVVSNIASAGTTWGNINNAFDGNTGTYADGTGNNGTVSTITFNKPLTGVTLLEYYWGGTSTYGYNTTNVGTGPSSSSPGYVTAYSGSAITINNLRAVSQPGDGVVRVYAIRVNGTVLTGYTEGNPAGNDSLVDVPSSSGTDTGVGGEVGGNYGTFNALVLNGNTLTNGNLSYLAGAANKPTLTTFGIPPTGKWYFEFTDVDSSGSFTGGVGTEAVSVSSYLGSDANGWSYQTHPSNAGYHNNGVFTTTGRINGAGSNTIVGVAIDRDAQKIWFSVNGTFVNSGAPASGTNAQYSNLPTSGFLLPGAATNNAANIHFNAGQRAFAYTAPSGFKALCTANLPAPLVTKPSTVMDILLWTGTGTGADRTISGLSFSNTPGLIWGKGRSVGYHHTLWDIVRGYGLTNVLSSDRTEGQGWTASGRIKTATSSSITWEADSGSLWYDGSSTTYAAWCWDAGSSTVTNNTAGTITPTGVRANATAGFSIVTYTGTGSNATVGHGLGVAPSMVIVKKSSAAGNWEVYFKDLGASYYLELEKTNAKGGPYSGLWNDTAPTSTVFSIGSDSGVNSSGATYVAYCWAPVVGYSSAFSITGNGSTDGPMCYLGFRPRMLIYKRTDVSGDRWLIWDAARNSYNQMTDCLFPNLSNAELNGYDIDFLSNGFKLRDTESAVNASGGTYIGFAWAESPLQYSRAA